MDYKQYASLCEEIVAITDEILIDLPENKLRDFLFDISRQYIKRVNQNCRAASLLLTNMQEDYELSLGLMFRANILDMINVFYLSGFLMTGKIDRFKDALLKLQADSIKKYYDNMRFAYENAQQHYVDRNPQETANRIEMERLLRVLFDRLPKQYPDLINITTSVFPKLEFKYHWPPTKNIINEIHNMRMPVAGAEEEPVGVNANEDSLELFHRITGRLFSLYSEYSQYEHASEVAILFDTLPFTTRHPNLVDAIYMLNKCVETGISVLMATREVGVLKSTINLQFEKHKAAIKKLNDHMMAVHN